MARPPSMTREAAEAAAIAAVGPRGALVTSENRSHIQAWLCAAGIPSVIAKAARLATLNKAWAADRYLNAMLDGIKRRNGGHLPTTPEEDTNAQLAQMDAQDRAQFQQTITKLADDIADDATLEDDTQEPAQAPAQAPKPAPATRVAPDAATDALAALKRALGAGALDEDRVREIATEIAEDRGSKNAEAILAMVERQLAGMNKPRPVTVRIEDVATREARDLGLQHATFPKLVKLASIRMHDGTRPNVWIAGPAGSGKTTAANSLAKALDLPFFFNGAIDTEHKLLGFVDAQGRIVSRPFRKAYESGGVYLFDEVDASYPAALLAFNAALANGSCDFPDQLVSRHPDCIILAGANTWGGGATTEYVGRAKQDAAFSDRFIKLAWNYDPALERETCGNPEWAEKVQAWRAKAATKGLKVVISPRASYFGAAMLASGHTEAEAIEATIAASLAPAQWEAIRS